MTVSITIEPETWEKLKACAQSRNEPIESLIRRALESETSLGPGAIREMTGPEKAAAFDAWTRSFPAGMPLLSLDDISREKIHGRD